MFDLDDTIVAIASPAAPAPRGIVRISGSGCVGLLNAMGIDVDVDATNARRLTGELDVGAPLGLIDADVLLWPTKRSYTGQPSAEIHTDGSVPLLNAIVEKVTECGARAARPGEFTMRAFLAGQLDLTQAEAVLGVIEADTRGALDEALEQLAGNLSKPLEAARSEMLDLLADVEAGLDFVDEDIEFISDAQLVDRLAEVQKHVSQTRDQLQLRSADQGVLLIALRGQPNAGKSHLLNALASREIAIVADVAGTTRDAVTAEVAVGTHRVLLCDTAGIEEAHGAIGELSQQQAEEVSARADIRLWCVDASRDDWSEAARVTRERAVNDKQALSQRRSIDLFVATKIDLAPELAPDDSWIHTSAQTNQGIEGLRKEIEKVIDDHFCEETGSATGTAARCRGSLQQAEAAIGRAIDLTEQQMGHELVASEIRAAVSALGEVTGEVYTDDILDRVFGRFCIGK